MPSFILRADLDGAAQELQQHGSQWTTVATLGDWRSIAFKGYLDLTNQLSRDLSKLLAEEINLDSDGEEFEEYVPFLWVVF